MIKEVLIPIKQRFYELWFLWDQENCPCYRDVRIMEVLVTRISAVFRFGLPCVCLFACMIVCLFVCLFLSLFAFSFSYVLSTSSASLQKTCNKLYLPTHGMRTREIHMYVIEQACGPCLGIGGGFFMDLACGSIQRPILPNTDGTRCFNNWLILVS